MNRPNILVINDDGIHAPGIQSLIEIVKDLGRVIVVAPKHPQSGKSHAITVERPLRITQLKDDADHLEFVVDGTPVDCVKLALDKILDSKPDLVVSGINHGSNSSINVLYSGTMAAAIEGSSLDIPSIGFSTPEFSWEHNMLQYKDYVKKICSEVLTNKLPLGISLNVNIPSIDAEDIQGIKICRQAKAFWHEEFDKRTDPNNNDYYWLTGTFKNEDAGTDTDEWALKNNYISIVPVSTDMTAYNHLDKLNNWKLNA